MKTPKRLVYMIDLSEYGKEMLATEERISTEMYGLQQQVRWLVDHNKMDTCLFDDLFLKYKMKYYEYLLYLNKIGYNNIPDEYRSDRYTFGIDYGNLMLDIYDRGEEYGNRFTNFGVDAHRSENTNKCRNKT